MPNNKELKKTDADSDIDLDGINNTRVVDARDRVAEVICMLYNPVGCLEETGSFSEITRDTLAKALNMLEAAGEDIGFACEHFQWNNDVVFQIDEACRKLGECLAYIVCNSGNKTGGGKNGAAEKQTFESMFDAKLAGSTAASGLADLGKALATLVRWFAEDDGENPEKQ